MLFARISDIVGRRVAFVAAYSIFIVFSVACGFSQSTPLLIAFRALQGLGGSGRFSFPQPPLSLFFLTASLKSSRFALFPLPLSSNQGVTCSEMLTLFCCSGLYSISMVILPEVTPSRRQQAIGAIVAVVLTSSGVLGPVLGGILTQYVSWRWVFWIKFVIPHVHYRTMLTTIATSGPVGGVSLFVFLFAWEKKRLPTPRRRSWRDVDYVGSLLL